MPRNMTGDGTPSPSDPSCVCGPAHACRIEVVLTVDDRDQMVLPKDVRLKAGLSAGDKLALIGWEREARVCCPALMEVENLSGMARDVLRAAVAGDTVRA